MPGIERGDTAFTAKLCIGMRLRFLTMCVCLLQVEAALLAVHAGRHQQAVPAFAASMSLLEPSRMPGTPETFRAVSAAQLPVDSSADPFSPALQAEAPLDLFGTGSSSPSLPRRVETHAMPSSSPALLDLSFGGFDSTLPAEPAAGAVPDLLQSDLMGLDFSSTADSGWSTSPVSNAPQKADALTLDQTSELVVMEVERVVASLPDLSFMLSRTLMFPTEVLAPS